VCFGGEESYFLKFGSGLVVFRGKVGEKEFWGAMESQNRMRYNNSFMIRWKREEVGGISYIKVK